MARVSGSTRVVAAALAGNLAVAAVKFAAFAVTRSGSMLSEAVHSLVDTADQLLLLVGQRRAARAPDEGHPFGYGMEMYFWAFIVALLIFFAGGAVALWEGWSKIVRPAPIERPWVNLVVIAACALFEGASLRTAWREYRRVVRGADVGPLRFVRLSKDPSVFTTLLEDSAALAGLGLAALGTLGSGWLGLVWADGAASMAIGLLLLAVATLLTNESRSLIAGETAAPPIQRRIREAAEAALGDASLRAVTSLQFGPRAILVFVTVDWPAESSWETVRALTVELTRRVKAADPRIVEVSFRSAAAQAPKAAGSGGGGP